MVEDDSLRPPEDSRHFFMLPQTPMDSGYYVYGELHKKPARGAYQYASPLMMTAILRVAFEWQAIDKRRFGVGDISIAGGGATPDHRSHKNGLQVDVRPLRKDGLEEGVIWSDSHYDKEGTKRLIEMFRTFAPVVQIFFNDPNIPFVKKMKNHDNHFHVELRG
ncbi:penicillin-insensitive murein endopeptidase [Duganella radicis]|uniref:Penicillin-insensitive murein endopeptidase n=1 Tax=Duganella radicis TaxID=551988 RepID=A0A6L6PKJ4_9BURK|nr:penicillin-insensitive murein endopeptidase [Duganella radicis]MTV39472.1 hypothetical protein [Duganella radicis]